MMSCERCGSPGKSSDKFCGSCGSPFKASSSAVPNEAEKSDSKKGGRIGKILIALVTVVVIGVSSYQLVQSGRSLQISDIQVRDVFETTTIDVVIADVPDYSQVYVQGAEEYCSNPRFRRVAESNYQVLCDRIPSGTSIKIVVQQPDRNSMRSFIIG